MDDFTITTRLKTKEYAKIMFLGLYKKAAFILATLAGLYFSVTVILDYLQVIDYYSDIPVFEICYGLFLLLAPTLIVILSVKQFLSNPSFQNDINYTFGNNGIAVNSLTFKSEFLWEHIIKQKELGKYLILYHSKKFGNYLYKTKLTTDNSYLSNQMLIKNNSAHNIGLAKNWLTNQTSTFVLLFFLQFRLT